MRLPADQERRMLLTLAGIQFTHIIDFMIVMPLGPQFTRQFGLSAQQFGFLVSAYTFAAALSALFAALFVDRYERKRVVLTLYILFMLATLACALAPNFTSLMLARALAGAFGGVLGAMVMTIVGDTVPDARRGRATGLVMSAFSLATVAGVPLGLLIAGHVGWRGSFVFVAALSALIWFAGLRWLPRIDEHLKRHSEHAQPAHAPDALRGLWRTLTSANHLRAFGFMLLLMFAGFTVIPYLSIYLVANMGVREIELPYVYLAGGVATFVTARLIGRWADRFGKPRVFRWICALSIAPLLLMTHANAVALWFAIAMSTSFFVLISGRMIPAMAIITGSSVPAERGAFMSLNSAVQQAGSGLSALIAGSIVHKLPLEQGGQLLQFNWVGYLAVACTLSAMWWVGRLRALDTDQ